MFCFIVFIFISFQRKSSAINHTRSLGTEGLELQEQRLEEKVEEKSFYENTDKYMEKPLAKETQTSS
jgi:hypothetical protein